MSEQKPQEEKIDIPLSDGDHPNCARCRRRLKNPVYRKIGLGYVCLMKANVNNKDQLIEKMNTLLSEQKKNKKMLLEKPKITIDTYLNPDK